jgi:Tfp pilus assembly protein PilN
VLLLDSLCRNSHGRSVLLEFLANKVPASVVGDILRGSDVYINPVGL